MPRNPRRCSYCRSEHHIITHCEKWKLEFTLNIIGRSQGRYKTNIPKRCFPLSKINLRRLSLLKLLMEGKIPIIVVRMNAIGTYVCGDDPYTHLNVVRYENDATGRMHFNISNEYPNPFYESISKSAKAYPNTIKNYTAEYSTRITQYKNAVGRDYMSVDDMSVLLVGDHIQVTRRHLEARRIQQEQIERWRQQRQAQAQQHQVQSQRFTAIINRVVLPIITDTPIQADDCPICMEVMGDTSKAILRCGHQLCVSCLMTCTLNKIVSQSRNTCNCPVCRTSYISI